MATEPDLNSNDGWIEWAGGECPVDRYARINIRTADGWEDPAAIGAVFWPDRWWRHDATDPNDNIVAYRVVSA